MPIFTALTTLTGEAPARALAEALERMEPAGVGVFEVEDGSGLWEVGGYFETEPDGIVLALLAEAFGAAEFAVSELPETDWVAKVRRDLPPVEAGRFFVYGSHDADRVPPGRVPLLIEAAVAFGTGHHGTTLGCLRAFDRLLGAGVRPGRVADVGCGTAVLALAAAATLPEAGIVASDIDPVAVEVAEANARANGLAGRLRCVEAPGFDHAALSGPFDLVFANILKGPLLSLAPDIAGRLAAGGVAILSGLLVTQAEEVTAAYLAQGLALAEREDLGDWSTLTFRS
jgi:ribosomal protein L11 methyltransferase